MAPATARKAATLRFGRFELDTGRGELRNDGQVVRLQPQPLQLLLTLLRAPGVIVTREELRQALWAGETFVDFEDGLHKAVGKLREALGDSAQEPRFIETVPRRGYRFIARLEEPESRPAKSPFLRRGWLLGGVSAVAVVLVVAAVWWPGALRSLFPGAGHSRTIRSIAVLPLDNLTGDPQQEYLVDGITEDLITQLSQVRALTVISRTSVMRYKQTKKSTPEIARELAVGAVVEGAVQRSGSRVRVTMQLIDGATDHHLWAGTYERDTKDLLALQDEVARAIAAEINIKISAQEQVRLSRRPVNQEAYEAFLRARHAIHPTTREGLLKAIEYFEEAVQKDPSFALAWAELSHADNYLSFLEGLPLSSRARTTMDKALELNPALGEAQLLVGDTKFYWEWDWVGGLAAFRHAAELDPGAAETRVHYAIALSYLGRYREALPEAERACQLDPLIFANSLGTILRQTGQPLRVIEHYRKLVELAPDRAAFFTSLSSAYEDVGQYEEAVDACMKAERLGNANAERVKALEDAYATGGVDAFHKKRTVLDREELKQNLARLQQQARRTRVPPLRFANIYVRLGQKDEALKWLDRAYRERCPNLVVVKENPLWDPLRSDRRFQNLLRRMNFPPTESSR